MDAGPLIKLALARELDLLLAFDIKVYIPDEVYFEAVEKQAWERRAKLTPDKLYLRDWVGKNQARNLVAVPETLIGEIARNKRASGEYAPGKKNHRKHTGELAAHDFFNHRDDWGHPGEPALLLVDDGPGIDRIRIENLDVHVLTTYSMLVAFQEAGIIASSKDVWQRIVAAIPTVEPIAADESMRRDTVYRSSLRIRK
jgi:hypothetical protein